MDGVTLLLVQEMVYTCNLGEGEDERQKKEVLVTSDDHDTSDADPGETKIYDKLKLKIKPKEDYFHETIIKPGLGETTSAGPGPQSGIRMILRSPCTMH